MSWAGVISAAFGRDRRRSIVMMLLVATFCFAAQHALPGDAAVQVAVARLGRVRRGRRDRPRPRSTAASTGRSWFSSVPGSGSSGPASISGHRWSAVGPMRGGALPDGLPRQPSGSGCSPCCWDLLIAVPLGGRLPDVAARAVRPTADRRREPPSLFVALPPFLLGLVLVAVTCGPARLAACRRVPGTGSHLVLPVDDARSRLRGTRWRGSPGRRSPRHGVRSRSRSAV